MNQFTDPNVNLAGLDAESTASLISAAADVALVMDDEGVIRDVAMGEDNLDLDHYRSWVGRPWSETVAPDSRGKVMALLQDASKVTSRQWRHINYPSTSGPDVPVLYSAIRVGAPGRVVAFGRDLRPQALLQQRLVDAQQSMERDYLRLRHMETRYRYLFQTVSEAVMVVDASSQKVLEANPAAGQLVGMPPKDIIGGALLECFDGPSRQNLITLLASARASGRASEIRAKLAGGQWELTVSASLLRQEAGAMFLVRLAPVQADTREAPMADAKKALLRVVESVPDGFVVTDPEGRILTANSAFVEMTQLATNDQVQGESLDRWLGRTGVDLTVLVNNLRQHGTLRLFATTLRGQYGLTTPVEISGTAVLHGEPPCLGFAIRDVGRRLSADPRGRKELPRSVAQLTELVGRVPMKDIVGETTDLIEQLCIEAALELTRDNRASAAEMLGLSRQSLYVKLRRYGLGDLVAEGEK